MGDMLTYRLCAPSHRNSMWALTLLRLSLTLTDPVLPTIYHGPLAPSCTQTFRATRTDAFLWQLPFPYEPASADTGYSTEADVVPSLDDTINAGGVEGDTWRGRYLYMGGMPDLHSSEVTALSVKAPLLATGLANGRIFLWRCDDAFNTMC